MIVFLALVCFFFLFKAKITGSCNPDSATSRSTTDAVKGVFIIFVFFRHASQYVLQTDGTFNLWGDWLYFHLDVILEQLIVVMFLFYSGFGVASARLKKGATYARSLPLNRITPVFLNFAVAVTVFGFVGILLGCRFAPKTVFLSYIGWESLGNSNWYIFDILLCYCATYVVFMLFPPEKSKGACLTTLATLIILVEILLSQYKGPHWYNTILCYVFGVWYAFNIESVRKIIRSKYSIIAICAGLTLFFSRVCPIEIFGLVDNVGACAFSVLILCFTSFIEPKSVVLGWLGERLFPLYIYQRLPMLVLAALFPVFVSRHYMAFFCVSGVVTIMLASLYRHIKIEASLVRRIYTRVMGFWRYVKRYGLVWGIVHEFDRDCIPGNVALWHRLFNRVDYSVSEGVRFVDVLLTFSMGGGASDYVMQKLKKRSNDVQTFVVKEIHAKGVLAVEVWIQSKVSRRFYIRKLSELECIKMMAGESQLRIVINELVLWNYYRGYRTMTNNALEGIIDEIVSLKNSLCANMLFLVHDYFAICPRITLLTPDFKYCNPAPEYVDCDMCVRRESVLPLAFDHKVNVCSWRKAMSRLIVASEEVRTFSQDSCDRMRRFFPSARLSIIPHELTCTFGRMPKLMAHNITIGVFGEVSRTKGADLVLGLADYLSRMGRDDVKIVVVGVISLPVNEHKNIVCLGRYSRERLPDIIERAGINVAFFSSVWPETFSYVVQEIIALGLPVACFDLGAPAERVRRYEKGIVIPDITPESAWKSICLLFEMIYG